MLKRTCVPTPPNRLRFALDDALSAVKAACAAFSAPCIKQAKIRIIEIEHVGKGWSCKVVKEHSEGILEENPEKVNTTKQ